MTVDPSMRPLRPGRFARGQTASACAGRSRVRRTDQGGYILLEAVLALMIFGIAIVGLVQALNSTLDVTNAFERDAMVRQALRSFAAEVQVERDIRSMAREEHDEERDIRFTSEVEQLALASEGRRPLSNMYELTVTANYGTSSGERQEVVQMYIHRPR